LKNDKTIIAYHFGQYYCLLQKEWRLPKIEIDWLIEIFKNKLKYWNFLNILNFNLFFIFIDFRILKFYEFFERVVSLLRHAMGCLPGNNRVVSFQFVFKNFKKIQNFRKISKFLKHFNISEFWKSFKNYSFHKISRLFTGKQ
jgi:hypothetical protein